MSDLKIEGTKKSPNIEYSSDKNILTINGRSIMDNLEDDFYYPVFKLLKNIQKENKHNLRLEFNLEYFNTASHLSIIKILREVDKIEKAKIMWSYDSDDEEMKEIGVEMEKFCDVKFIFNKI